MEKIDKEVQNKLKEIFSGNLLRYMRLNGITQADITNAFKLTASTVSDWCNGKKYPRMDKIQMLADYFGIMKSDLTEDKSASLPKNIIPIDDNTEFVKIPVIGRVAAGMQCATDTGIIDYEYVLSKSITNAENYVFLTVIGDSMYPNIHEGDRVMVKCQSSVDSGSIAVVVVDDEDGVVKRVIYDDNHIELHSINPMYPPRKFYGKDIQRIKVFGEVKKIIRNI